MTDDRPGSHDDPVDGALREITRRLGQVLAESSDPQVIFTEFTRELQSVYDICKGFLALREDGLTRFLAVATWNQGRFRKNLSLKLPTTESLFEKVSENGYLYTENFSELCDGNMIERRLLLDDQTRAFMLRPLKSDGRVIGLLGYSSQNPDAFVTFEGGLLDPVLDEFGEFLGKLPSKTSSAHLPDKS